MKSLGKKTPACSISFSVWAHLLPEFLCPPYVRSGHKICVIIYTTRLPISIIKFSESPQTHSHFALEHLNGIGNVTKWPKIAKLSSN